MKRKMKFEGQFQKCNTHGRDAKKSILLTEEYSIVNDFGHGFEKVFRQHITLSQNYA